MQRRLRSTAILSVLAVLIIPATVGGSSALASRLTWGVGTALTESRDTPKLDSPSKKTKPTATNSTTGDGATTGHIPTTSPAGWKLAFSDDFSGSRLGSKWFAYNGRPSGDPAGDFAGSHVVVGGGEVQLRGFRDPAHDGLFTTGGISTAHGFVQTYGKYLVRMRVDDGQGISYVAMLWPTSGGWPPEIDFAEDNGAPGRRTLTTTLHWKSATVANNMQHAVTTTDMTQWHTVGVEWSPGQVTYTLDGKAWSTITNPAVSTAPMALALQTQAWSCGNNWETCPDSSTPSNVDMDVDWVAAYSRD